MITKGNIIIRDTTTSCKRVCIKSGGNIEIQKSIIEGKEDNLEEQSSEPTISIIAEGNISTNYIRPDGKEYNNTSSFYGESVFINAFGNCDIQKLNIDYEGKLTLCGKVYQKKKVNNIYTYTYKPREPGKPGSSKGRQQLRLNKRQRKRRKVTIQTLLNI